MDENVDAAQALAFVIRKLGLEVEMCYDGPGALKAARRRRPDIIFLDIIMPGMDGFEVAQQLRQDSTFARTIIVAVSGLSSEEYRQRSREAGIDHFLVKPADPAFIDSLVRARRW